MLGPLKGSMGMKQHDRGKVNNEVNIRLTLLGFLSKKAYPAQIAKAMKVSRPAIRKQIKGLLAEGYITDLNTWPRTYAVTDKVNQVLAYSDKESTAALKNYEMHAIQVSYDIRDLGRLPKGEIRMQNWSYWREKFGDFEVRVNYGREPKMKIYPPRTYDDTKPGVYMRLGFVLADIVAFMCRTYGCDIDRSSQVIERVPEVHAPKDPLGTKLEALRMTRKGKNIELNQSGDGKFDIVSSNPDEPFDAFDKYDYMITHFPALVDVMTTYGNHLNAHIPALKGMIEVLPEVKDAAKALRMALEEFRRQGRPDMPRAPKAPQIEPGESWEALRSFGEAMG